MEKLETLGYRVYAWTEGAPNPAIAADRRGWHIMAKFRYLQEALDYVDYGTRRGVKMRLRGPANLDRVYEPGGGVVARAVATDGRILWNVTA